MKIRDTNIRNYNSYLNEMRINNRIKDISNAIINMFFLASFYIMASGFCAYFKQEYNLNVIYVAIVLSVLCYITFLGKMEKITKMNTILIPFLILMVLIIGIKCNILDQSTENMVQISNKSWIISSLEYASYNSILLIPIMIGLKKYTNKREKIVAVISGAILFILAMILFLILAKEGSNIQYELPLIQIVKKYGDIYKYIYGFVIVFAIFTSVIAAGYSFLENSTNSQKKYKQLCFIICTGIVIACNIEFSYLIKVIYPVFGILGLIQMVYFFVVDYKVLFIKLLKKMMKTDINRVEHRRRRSG